MFLQQPIWAPAGFAEIDSIYNMYNLGRGSLPDVRFTPSDQSSPQSCTATLSLQDDVFSSLADFEPERSSSLQLPALHIDSILLDDAAINTFSPFSGSAEPDSPHGSQDDNSSSHSEPEFSSRNESFTSTKSPSSAGKKASSRPPRHRRPTTELTRGYFCEIDGCTRRYENRRTLQFHMKKKHNQCLPPLVRQSRKAEPAKKPAGSLSSAEASSVSSKSRGAGMPPARRPSIKRSASLQIGSPQSTSSTFNSYGEPVRTPKSPCSDVDANTSRFFPSHHHTGHSAPAHHHQHHPHLHTAALPARSHSLPQHASLDSSASLGSIDLDLNLFSDFLLRDDEQYQVDQLKKMLMGRDFDGNFRPM